MAANDPDDPEIPKLLALMEEYRAQYDSAGKTVDRSNVEKLYKMDGDFTAYDIAPPLGGYIGWDQYAVGWYKVLHKYKEIHFKYRDDLRVFRKGDVAWASLSADWYGKTTTDEEFAKEIRMTLIWVRENGEWKITHEHGSSPRLTELPSGNKV
jgi:ketosteroid isomerase-like protein